MLKLLKSGNIISKILNLRFLYFSIIEISALNRFVKLQNFFCINFTLIIFNAKLIKLQVFDLIFYKNIKKKKISKKYSNSLKISIFINKY